MPREQITKRARYSGELRRQVVRAVLEHEATYPSRWAAIRAIGDMFQVPPETVRGWVRQDTTPAARVRASRPSVRSRRRGRPSGPSSQDTRERILEAARVCVAEHGNEATTRMIAERAGVTSNALYYYFPSKRELYDAVTELNEQSFYATLEAAMLERESLDGELTAMVDALEHFLADNPYFPLVLARTLPKLLAKRAPMPARARRFYDAIVARAEARGELRTGEADALVGFVAMTLLGIVVLGERTRADAFRGARWIAARAGSRSTEPGS